MIKGLREFIRARALMLFFIVSAAILLSIAVGLVVEKPQTEAYMLISVKPIAQGTDNAYTTNKRLETYRAVICSDTVISQAAPNTNSAVKESMRRQLSVSRVEGTEILRISYLAPDNSRAVNTLKRIYDASVQQLTATGLVQGVTVIDQPVIDDSSAMRQMSQRALRYAIVGLVVGILLAAALHRGPVVRSAEELEKEGIKVIGTLPHGK